MTPDEGGEEEMPLEDQRRRLAVQEAGLLKQSFKPQSCLPSLTEIDDKDSALDRRDSDEGTRTEAGQALADTRVRAQAALSAQTTPRLHLMETPPTPEPDGYSHQAKAQTFPTLRGRSN